MSARKASRAGKRVRRAPVVVGDVVHIPLTLGRTAIVDLVDAELANANWHLRPPRRPGGTAYAARSVIAPVRARFYLHREVAKRAGIDLGDLEVDHIDGDGLNNRRSNLRPATSAQNRMNQRDRPRKSAFRGVSWDQKAEKWRAILARRHLGSFFTQEEAAAAYRAAAVEKYGDFAKGRPQFAGALHGAEAST